MERAGRPTVTIVSSAFELLARAESRSLGMADLPVLVVPHPVAPQPPDVLREWGEKLCPDVFGGLISGDGRDG